MTTGLAGLSHAQGAPESQLLLGSTGAISGPIGAALRGVLAGASLAFDSVNAAGGIAGRRIRLISLDDELKPDRAIANYNALLQEHKVLALFGCGGSATTAAGAPLVKESGAPMVGGFGVADSARERVAGSAYFVRASSGREAQVLVQHITTLGITKVGMAAFDNPGGKEATALVERALAQQKLPLHYAGAIKGDGSNAKAVAEEIAKAAPQALIMYLVASQASTLVAAVRDVGAAPSFYGMSLVPGEVVAKSLGDRMPGLAISQLVPYPWAGADVDANTYRRLAEAANVPIGYPSYEGYINALVMIEALRRAGRDPTRQRLHAVLKTLKLRIAAAMDIDFTGGSPIAGSRFVEMVHVSRDGRFSR